MSTLLTTLSTLPLLVLTTLPQTTAQETQIITVTSTAPVSTITLAAATSTPTTTWTSPSQFQFSMLNSTNYFRYLYPAQYLSYNASLAVFAQSYADKCRWQHNPEIGELGYGENLAKGFTTPAAAVDAWGNEVELFDFSDEGYTGFTEETGHFTQLVWRATRTVGCGWTDCVDGRPREDGDDSASSSSSSASSSSSSSNDDDDNDNDDASTNAKRDASTPLQSQSQSKSITSRPRPRSSSSDGSPVTGIMLVCNYFPAGNIMAPSSDGSDEYIFFKQNIVPERPGGDSGFNSDEAGNGVGGPSGSATESLGGIVTASSGADGGTLLGLWRGSGFGKGVLGSLAGFGVGVVVGLGMLI